MCGFFSLELVLDGFMSDLILRVEMLSATSFTAISNEFDSGRINQISQKILDAFSQLSIELMRLVQFTPGSPVGAMHRKSNKGQDCEIRSDAIKVTKEASDTKFPGWGLGYGRALRLLFCDSQILNVFCHLAPY